MKKITLILVMAVIMGILFSCGGSFDAGKEISIVSREDGSGTRTAFIELFGVQVKGDDGITKDLTTKEAVIKNNTGLVMTNVSSDKQAIGYISLGSVNDTVKVVDIEGVKASNANVKNGSYPIARPFNIATKGDPTGLVKDFIDYVLSTEGQAVVSVDCVPVVDNAPAYSGDKPSGKIVISGSSSVTPLMQKLVEAYLKVNTNATIDIQQSDSSAGMNDAVSGVCDIGMASRDLKDSEKEQLNPITIAIDGIAVIVNKDNTITNLTKEQVKSIYTGEVSVWSEIIG